MADMVYRVESEAEFGPFAPEDYYDIEASKDIQAVRGRSLKSVEFVILRKGKLLFIEAKKTAPKELRTDAALARLSQMIKRDEKEAYTALLRSLRITPAYVSDLCEKFLTSLSLVRGIAQGSIPSDGMPSAMLKLLRDNFSAPPVFVLVITWSREDWASSVQDALNMALRKFEPLTRAKVLVLTAEKARQKGLVRTYTPMPEEGENFPAP